MQIFAGEEASICQTTVGGRKIAIFSVLSVAVSTEALEMRPTLIYYVVPRRLSADPKIRNLEWPWIAFLGRPER